MFGDTFALINLVGFSLPTDFTPLQEQQLNQLWHGIVSLVMIVMIMAHIYIGSIGMEGAIDAMNTGGLIATGPRNTTASGLKKKTQKAAKPAE